MDIREKLVELLRNSPHLDTVKGYKGNDCTFEQGADWLIAHGVTVQEWISVKERLPEEDGSYLVYSNSFGNRKSVKLRWFAKDAEMAGAYDLAGQKNVWYLYDSECGYISINSVTHWMPLPEPPKGE